MYVNRSYLHELFRKLVADQCSDEELSEFLQLIRYLPNDDPLINVLEAHWHSAHNAHDQPDDATGNRIHKNILSKIRGVGVEVGPETLSVATEKSLPEPALPRKPFRMPTYSRWAAAAAVVVLIVGVYLLDAKQTTDMATATSQVSATVIHPGKNGAILTLADGSQLVLDSAGNGLLAHQQQTQVVLKNGELVYEAPGSWSGEILYNSMTTPKGRQFHLVLSDGTRVWLNAQSSIRYPTVFAGPRRIVEITGEAYFEVASNERQPFTVRVNDQAEVNALGTQFNIKAYGNEADLITTLVEGSVSVQPLIGGHPKSGSGTVILTPSEQAVIHPTSGSMVVKQTDVDRVMAWKNGYFSFEETSFTEILRQLERWYDIEVEVEGDVPDIRFFGEMSRNIQLTDLLEGLEASGVHFRIEAGRRLVVTR